MRHRLAVIAPLVLAVANAHAQRSAPPFLSVPQPVDTQSSTLMLSVGLGLGLGLAGFLVGGAAGYGLSSGCSEDWCQLPGVFVGAAAGGTFGMALGVHLGNRRQGNLALDCLAGAGVWGVGFVTLVLWSGWKPPATSVLAWAIPTVQLITTILVEQATARSRAGPAKVSVVPDGNGGVALDLGVPF